MLMAFPTRMCIVPLLPEKKAQRVETRITSVELSVQRPESYGLISPPQGHSIVAQQLNRKELQVHSAGLYCMAYEHLTDSW